MNLIFNRSQEQHDVTPSVPVRYSLTAYSNLGYESTPDLTLAENPTIYSIEQELQSETSFDVNKFEIRFDFIFSCFYLVKICRSNSKCITNTSYTYEIWSSPSTDSFVRR